MKTLFTVGGLLAIAVVLAVIATKSRTANTEYDIGVIEVTEPRVHFDLASEGVCYVTVMAFDAYGERIGRTLYLVSNELQIRVDS